MFPSTLYEGRRGGGGGRGWGEEWGGGGGARGHQIIRYIRARRLGGLRKEGARVEAERQVKERFQAEAARMRTSAIALLLI